MAGAMPPNHAQTLRERTPLSRRARWLWALSGLAVLVAVLILVLSSGTTARPGCIHVDLPGAMGAEPLDACGGSARSTCAGVRSSHQFSAVEVLELTRACRRAGLPAG